MTVKVPAITHDALAERRRLCFTYPADEFKYKRENIRNDAASVTKIARPASQNRHLALFPGLTARAVAYFTFEIVV